jgi:hypothetical protein
MKLGKKKLAIALGAALSFGVAGQASADVYGLSTVEIDDLLVIFNLIDGGATSYTFSTNQDAILNGVPDLAPGNASCGGLFPSPTSCLVGPPVLSGTVQNAPGGGVVVRGESDYTVYGQNGNYSTAESEITTATLVTGGTTSTNAISESNLDDATSAQANTVVQSNTLLELEFTVGVGGGSFSIDFNAIIDVLAEVSGGDLGLAQANSGLTVNLQQVGVTLASWAPSGTNTVTTCGAGLTCTATEAATSLNNTVTTGGLANQVSGGGAYSLDVTGLTEGGFTLALATTTSTDLTRFPVPVPGTLMLMGTGLLLGARATRRNKK